MPEQVDLANDPELAAALRVAKAWGVPPTIFLGRQRAIRYEYNAAGDVARTVADAEWIQADRELAAAWEAYQATLCPNCGGDLAETLAPENENAYHAKCLGLCFQCRARRVEAEKYEQGGNRFTDLMLFAVTKKDDH